jgi:hypothetical protein
MYLRGSAAVRMCTVSASGSLTITIQFREFAGRFTEHCHNTVYEDHAMLLRYEVGTGLVPVPTPNPAPQAC